MGLFDKRKKLTFDYASGFIFTTSLLTKGNIRQMKLDIDEQHRIAVDTGYIMGLSFLFTGKQIGIERINKFIDSAMKNAEETINASLVPIIPFIRKYCEFAVNWILKESSKVNFNDLVVEYSKKYLNDLYDGEEYSSEMLKLAINDMLFYYETLSKITSAIKII